MVKQTTRDIQGLIDEAATISLRFRESGKAPREPHVVSRLLALLEETGLGVVEFCRRAKVNASSVYMWKSGKTTSGKDWPALAAAIAKRDGASLAAVMNAEIGGGAATPAKVEHGASTSFPGVEEVRMYRDRSGAVHETAIAAHHANEAVERRRCASEVADYITRSGTNIDLLVDVLMSDEICVAMWGIVQGRVAYVS